jgi:arginyl-tRNA synthetase
MKIEKIREIISKAIKEAFPEEKAPSVDLALAPEGIADIATTVPFKLAKMLHKNPMLIAEEIKKFIQSDNIESVSIAKPGYLNINLSNNAYKEFLKSIDKDGTSYFRKAPLRKKVQIEFVSANPTGPLHVGNGRGGIIGDVLANVLELLGYEVEREYYINDAGSKMDIFAKSIQFYYFKKCGKESQFPDEGYKGEYVDEIAEQIYKNIKDSLLKLESKTILERIKALGKEMVIESIKRSLLDFGVKFDGWFYESTLYGESNAIENALNLLRSSVYTYDKDGALWFRSTAFGDDKDRVIVRKNGEPTYALGDVAYHINKWQRGFAKAIDIWGADHFGHIIPVKALLQGAGLPKDFLDVLIYQMVHLYENGVEVIMSKHTGTFVTLDELIQEVGKDAARFFFLEKSADSHLNFDMNLAKSQSMDNPVYYVQYTYARLKKILSESVARGIEGKNIDEIDVSLLSKKEEKELLRKLFFINEEFESIGREYSIHRIPFLTVALCQEINAFYQKHRVLNANEYTLPRLVLVKTSLTALSLLFDLMGIEKKEQM